MADSVKIYNKLSDLKPVIFAGGEDYYLVTEFIKGIINLLSSGTNDVDYAAPGEDESFKNIFFECGNYPFMSEKRIVYVSGRNTLLAEDRRALVEYLEKPSETSVLLIMDMNKVFKEFYKKADYIELNRLPANAVTERIIALAAQSGSAIDRDAALLLTEYTDRYLSRADLEVKKLAAYAGKNVRITQADVKACVQPEADYQIFQFIGSAVNGDGTGALNTLNSLLDSGMAPIVLLASLINQYRKLLNIALRPEMKDEELSKLFGIPSFAVGRERAAAKKYTQIALKKTLDKLYELEFSFKSGRMNESDALNVAVAGILSRRANG